MSAARTRRKPANDLHLPETQVLGYVSLPRVFWNRARIIAAAVLGIFVVVAGVVALAFFVPAPSAAPAPKQIAVVSATPASSPAVEPYDIRINASDLAPPSSVIEDALPITITRAHALPPVLDITVEDDAPSAPPVDQAAYQAAVAQSLFAKGDLTQALHFQHRAAELAPDNMLLRLTLAIFYDRAGDAKGALMLYRQVAQAYADHAPSLPQSININDIRRRAAWLAARDSQ